MSKLRVSAPNVGPFASLNFHFVTAVELMQRVHGASALNREIRGLHCSVPNVKKRRDTPLKSTITGCQKVNQPARITLI
jgi:hypothetical protein